jgi:hypothetical protein
MAITRDQLLHALRQGSFSAAAAELGISREQLIELVGQHELHGQVIGARLEGMVEGLGVAALRTLAGLLEDGAAALNARAARAVLPEAERHTARIDEAAARVAEREKAWRERVSTAPLGVPAVAAPPPAAAPPPVPAAPAPPPAPAVAPAEPPAPPAAPGEGS